MNVDQTVLNQQHQAEQADLTLRTASDTAGVVTHPGYAERARAARRAEHAPVALAEQAWLRPLTAHTRQRRLQQRTRERVELGDRVQDSLDLENQNPRNRPDPTRQWPWRERRAHVISRRAEHAHARAAARLHRDDLGDRRTAAEGTRHAQREGRERS